MAENPSVPTSDDDVPPATRAATPSAADLSREIEAAVEREPGDEVRCTRVNGDHYRCNWWSAARNGSYDNPSMKGGQLATDHRIRKSRFLHVTKSRGGLKVTERSSG